MLARALTFPTSELMGCAIRVLVHLGRTAHESLRFSRDSPDAAVLHVYTDSDWDMLNGTTGTVHMLAGAAIAHNSKTGTLRQLVLDRVRDHRRVAGRARGMLLPPNPQ